VKRHGEHDPLCTFIYIQFQAHSKKADEINKQKAMQLSAALHEKDETK